MLTIADGDIAECIDFDLKSQGFARGETLGELLAQQGVLFHAVGCCATDADNRRR